MRITRGDTGEMKKTKEDVELDDFGRFSEPALLILISLAEEPKHGYSMTEDIEMIAGVRLGPGTLYGAITRLEARGLIESLGAEDRRRPYRLTAHGRAVLTDSLAGLRRIVDVGSTRLAATT